MIHLIISLALQCYINTDLPADDAKVRLLDAVENNCRWRGIMNDVMDSKPEYWAKRWHRYQIYGNTSPSGYNLWLKSKKEIKDMERIAGECGINL